MINRLLIMALINCIFFLTKANEHKLYLKLPIYEIINIQLDSITSDFLENSDCFSHEPKAWNYAMYITVRESQHNIILREFEDIYIEKVPLGVIMVNGFRIFVFIDGTKMQLRHIIKKSSKFVYNNNFYYSDEIIKVQTSYGYQWDIVFDGADFTVIKKYCSPHYNEE